MCKINLQNFGEELELTVENFEIVKEDENTFYNYEDENTFYNYTAAYFEYTLKDVLRFIKDWEEDVREVVEFIYGLLYRSIETEYYDSDTQDYYVVTATFKLKGE